eukprot:TRINITY_DN1484_c0_g1_i1.p1 TRINITY_DN1484_c0_g1~~TRINITY_DN1484_c0_g1_i1.p1  ORF type:complete len:709 (+),score=175.66 TRINITY_DN1484_c0_g1_i1:68-2128(+)
MIKLFKQGSESGKGQPPPPQGKDAGAAVGADAIRMQLPRQKNRTGLRLESAEAAGGKLIVLGASKGFPPAYDAFSAFKGFEVTHIDGTPVASREDVKKVLAREGAPDSVRLRMGKKQGFITFVADVRDGLDTAGIAAGIREAESMRTKEQDEGASSSPRPGSGVPPGGVSPLAGSLVGAHAKRSAHRGYASATESGSPSHSPMLSADSFRRAKPGNRSSLSPRHGAGSSSGGNSPEHSCLQRFESAMSAQPRGPTPTYRDSMLLQFNSGELPSFNSAGAGVAATICSENDSMFAGLSLSPRAVGRKHSTGAQSPRRPRKAAGGLPPEGTSPADAAIGPPTAMGSVLPVSPASAALQAHPRPGGPGSPAVAGLEPQRAQRRKKRGASPLQGSLSSAGVPDLDITQPAVPAQRTAADGPCASAAARAAQRMTLPATFQSLVPGPAESPEPAGGADSDEGTSPRRAQSFRPRRRPQERESAEASADGTDPSPGGSPQRAQTFRRPKPAPDALGGPPDPPAPVARLQSGGSTGSDDAQARQHWADHIAALLQEHDPTRANPEHVEAVLSRADQVGVGYAAAYGQLCKRYGVSDAAPAGPLTPSAAGKVRKKKAKPGTAPTDGVESPAAKPKKKKVRGASGSPASSSPLSGGLTPPTEEPPQPSEAAPPAEAPAAGGDVDVDAILREYAAR